MATREAACHCGQLRLEGLGRAVRGHDLQLPRLPAPDRKRFRDASGIQGRSGAGHWSLQDFTRISDEADRKEDVFHFCPDCGSQVFYTEPTASDLIVVSVGAIADPSFPPPTESGYESRRHPWINLPASIARQDPQPWASLHPLYEAGEYAEAADRGLELLDTYPQFAGLYYNVACCESFAGRTADALEHLRRAIEMSEDFRALATGDSDFAPIRDEPEFAELING